MKIKNGFVMNKVGSQYVVVPVGEASVNRRCMIRLNETGAFLWNCLENEATQDDLARALLNEYNVDESAAQEDVSAFVEKLHAADLLDNLTDCDGSNASFGSGKNDANRKG